MDSEGAVPQIHLVRLTDRQQTTPEAPPRSDNTLSHLPTPAKTAAVQIRVTEHAGSLRTSAQVVWRVTSAPPYRISYGTRVNLRDETGAILGITRSVESIALLGKSWVFFQLSDGQIGSTRSMLLAVPIANTKLTVLMRIVHAIIRGLLDEAFPDITLPLPLPLLTQNGRTTRSRITHLLERSSSDAPRPSGKASHLADAIILDPLPPPIIPPM
ncbi:hypothetical protein EIP86_009262 [Pleurotus ostreatoroseus]|nr:hypothetical protein EIP86_009262 [Pleurotus ostreatoroseus]